jgi:transcriptional regulator with XRE-family HTH domain
MFFQTITVPKPLGPLLREARESRGLTIAEAARAVRLAESEIELMESEQAGSVRPDRLHAVTYSRILGLDPMSIRESLPPMPALMPEGRQYLANYSRPLRPPFRLNLSLLAPLAPLGRAAVYVLLIATFLSTWGMMRQLSRVRSIPWVTSNSALPAFQTR